MTNNEILEVLNEISYKDWILTFNPTPLYIQWVFWSDDEKQHGRKWLLSEHMTKSELVLTALKAALSAEEHEAREAFRYKNKKIFGPHFDVDKLVEFATYKANLDLRP